MNILIRSSSLLFPDFDIWKNIHRNAKFVFAEYSDFHSNKYYKKKVDNEILVIFLRDIIENTDVTSYQKIKDRKINKLIPLIENKLKKNKEINFIICVSNYENSNIVNNAKLENNSNKLKNFFLQKIYNLSKKYSNLYIVDMDTIFSEEGYKNCFDNRNYYSFRCRLSVFGQEILIKNLSKIFERIYNSNKKVLLLDCDNTLWGGVIAEDGIENLQIGQDGVGLAYQDFQKAIKKLQAKGIILVLVSKNNERDVKNVLENHKSMIIKNKDISAYKVNWSEKSKNIKKISEELFLGLDSFVFWDDNPIEREKVKLKLKDVDVIEPDKDIANWPTQLIEYNGFSKFSSSKEDLKKTAQYKMRSKFLNRKEDFKDEIDYLKKINIKPDIIKLNTGNINRAEQMCLKTNQFNFTTKRYKINDLKYLNKNSIVFLVNLKDDYGEHGIISLIIIKIIKKTLLVDTFLMSCRIMGRYLENWILNSIKKIALSKKCTNVFFEFTETQKNQIAKTFIKENDFKNVKLNESLKIRNIFNISKKSKIYEYDLKKKINFLKIYE